MQSLEEISKRIELIRQTTSMYPTEFARHLGMLPNTYLKTVQYHQRKPTIEMIQVILSKYPVSARWLLTGEGVMFEKPVENVDDSPEKLLEMAKSILSRIHDKLEKRPSADPDHFI